MGEDVDSRNFTRQDRQRYRGKVRRCLDVFAEMLAEARFDFERPLTGLEIEFNLIDADQDPAMRNADVLAVIANEDFQTELGQFNIEINVRPRGLAGTAVAELETELRASLNDAEKRSRAIELGIAAVREKVIFRSLIRFGDNGAIPSNVQSQCIKMSIRFLR